MNDWAPLLEMVEFKPIKKGKIIHANLKSIIMTGGLIYVEDNLLWCSSSHYALLKAHQEKRYFDLAETYLDKEVPVGLMLRQTDRGIRYE